MTISPDYNDAAGTIIDNAGNEMSFSETVVGADGAAPVFSSISPTENSSVAVADVGYRLSETIANGSIIFRRTGGSSDGSSPHTVSLSGSELSSGVRSSAALSNAPTLTSGGIYMLEFNGTDLGGNVGSELTITGVIFDGGAPTFVKAWQYDTDGNGNIDEIVVELSEDISDASVVYGDFALGSGSITGFSQASGSSANSKDLADDDEYITLEVSVTGTATVSVSYTDNNSGNDLEDLAGNDAASNASITADDQAAPAILSTSWQDTDSDGGIDRAVLTFSESIDITDGNAGDGFGAIMVNDGSAVTLDNANYAASNASSLTLNFLGDEITGTAISGLSITYDNSGSNAIKDRSSGTLEIGDNIVSLAYADAAKPAILSAVTGDNNADGTVDRLTLTFSESVVITDGGTDNDITLTGSSGSPVITAGTYSLSNPTTLTYVIGSSTANNTSLTITPTYAVSGSGIIKDASNNEMADGETVAGTDGSGPAIIAAVTSDADANGKIDQIELTFSENVDDSQGADLASNSVTLGSSYSVSSINTGSTGDDAQLRVVVTEAGSGVYDTELIPTVTLVQSKIGDGSNNQATTNQGAFTPSDGAAPVIVSTSFTDTNGNGSVDRATLTFSERINVTDGNAGDGFGAILINDGSAVTIDNANYAGSETDGSGNSTLALNFTGDEILGSNISSSTATYTSSGANAIKDESSATNEVVSQASLSYTDGGVPVITAASWQDADANGKIDRVVLTFSEPVTIVDGNGSDGFGAILINDGGAVTIDNANYAGSSVTSLTLNFSGDEIASTAISGLSVTYEDAGSNSISDASNEMADGDVAESYTDAALPAILSTSWQDTDSDGGIDRAVLTFSESIDITDGNAGDGFGAIMVNDGSAVTLDNANYAASNASSLTLNFLGDEITGTAISGLSITYDNSGSNAIKDRSSGTLEIGDNIVSLAYADAAKPAILSAVTGDNNADGTVDRLTLTFSESVVITDGGTDNDITLTGSSGSPVITAGTYSLSNPTTLTYVIGSSTANNTSLTITPTYAVSGSGIIKDASNNEMADGETVAGTDGSGPAIIAAVTSDADANGKIDQIELTFSENVDDSQGADLASNSVTLGSSYSVSSINTGSTGDDAQLRVVVTEAGSGVYDTELIPTVTLVQSKIGDGSNNQATTNQGAFTPSDGAAPVIVSTSFTDTNGNGSVDRATLTFSERINVTDGNAGDGFGAILINDGSAVTIDNANYAGSETDGSGNSTLALNFTGDEILGSNISSSTATYTSSGANAIKDESSATNEVVSQASLSYTDGGVPVITAASWQDADANGKIDRVVLTFSEPVTIVDGNGSDGFGAILINDGGAVTIDNANYAGSSVTSLTLNFSGDEIASTAISGLSVTYEDAGSNSISDASNEMADGDVAESYTDAALPAILSTSWQDTDSDGGIDRAVLTFSESIDITDGNAGDGFGAIMVNDGSAVTLDNANYAASNASSLTLNFLGDEITGTAISGLSITYDNSGSNAIKDRSSGTLEIGDNIVSLAYADAAKPAILSAVTGDNNADGTVDRLTLTFSESVVITDGGTDNDITLTGSSGSPVITAGTYSLSNPTTLTYVIGSSTANNTSLTITPTYAVSGSGIIKDASNNEMADGETVAGTDGSGPAIIAAVTSDADANGKIDQIELTFSENVDDSQGADLASNSVTLGSSYSVSSINTGSTGDDAQLRVVVTEAGSGVYDTELIPTVTLVQSKIGDGSNNQATTNQGAFTPSDGAAPVIVSTSFTDTNGNGSVDRATLTFSERINVTDGNAGDGFGAILINDGSAVTIDNANYAGSETDGSGNSTLALNFTGDEILGSNISSSTATYTSSGANAIKDESSATNEVVSQASLSYTDGGVPVITAASWQDADANGKIDRVVLTFSEPVTIVDGNGSDGFGAILINDGGAVTIDNANYAGSSVTSLTLNFSGDEIASTAISGLSVTYEDAGSNSISDASNEMADGDVAESYTDAALPAILSTSWQDTDSDGGIDRAVLTFSESIDITDGNAGDGFGAIMVNDGSAVTLDNANYAASNASSLTLNFLGDEITGTAISGLSITYDNSGSNAIKDRSSGTLEIGDNIVSLAYADAAKPAILSAVTGDNNADGTVDRLTLTFSESVVITDGGTDNDITLTGSSGSPVITAGTYSLSNPTTLTYVIGSSTANNTSLTITPTYAVSGSGIIKDASNNEMADGETVAGTDGSGPAIIAAVTSDADANGKIDQIELTFSENVDDSQGADLASNSVTLGSSYSVSSINTGSTGDDAQLRVVVTEAGSGVYDTELIPTVTLVQSKIGDGSNNQATTNQGAFTPSDGAAPVIVSAQTMDVDSDGKIDRVDLTFSENLDDSKGSNMNSNSFTLGSSYNVSSVVTGATG